MNVAFIPVRGGSKSIPLKNIKILCGKPLVYWTIKAACECKYIDIVYVATDNSEIRNAVINIKLEGQLFDKLEVISRSAESATDTATTEFAMLEFSKKYDFDNIALIQATSPMLTGEDLDGGFELFNQNGTDSVISVVRQRRFLWHKNENSNVIPANYDIYNRPRRQEFRGYLVENGAFYITSRSNLIKSQSRVSGNIKAYEMCEDSAIELDEPNDWIIVEKLMKNNGMGDEKKNIPEIKMFLTDCDGCLTDAGMYYSEFGDEMKKFNTRDGMGFSLLHKRGIITGIITSESMDLNRRRADKLQLDVLESGCKNKASAVKRICEQYTINLQNVAYVGDDINDLETIQNVGFGCCPADALPQVKKEAKYIAQTNGGYGVIREIADIILSTK